jgi:hypothetical protein
LWSRAASSSTSNAAVCAAASSIASGIPAKRLQIAAIVGKVCDPRGYCPLRSSEMPRAL